MHITIRRNSDLSPEELKRVGDLGQTVFGNDPYGYTWSNVDWHVLLSMDGEWVSHIDIIERTGAVNGQPIKLGGIGGVGTLPAWRRRGLAEAAMRAAMTFLRDELRVEFGLLICSPHMIPYYRKLGWQVVPGPLTFDQPQGQVTFADVTMILPCTQHDWPSGVIGLCGLPW